jgi:hypothetical protein
LTKETQGRRGGARRADALALACAAVFFAAFFATVLARGKFLVAGDAFYQSYPLRTVAWGMLRRGELPLWTPHVFSGYPLLSMAQLALGYPLTWLYLVLPGRWAEEIVVLAPFLLAPAFTYFYARRIGRTRPASLFAALAFAYGGAMCSRLGGLGLMANGEAWMPLFLVAVERARRASFVRCLLGATAAYSMSVLAGQAQAFVLVAMMALAYAAFVSIFQPADEAARDDGRGDATRVGGGPDAPAAGTGEGRRAGERARVEGGGVGERLGWLAWARWRPLAVACCAVPLSVGVAAFQVLESARAARRSVRSRLLYETFVEGSFTPAETLRSFLAPVHHYIEVSTYVAPLAALLAALAVARALRGRRPRARVLFWLGAAVLSWLLMLGGSTPLYRALYHVPVFNLFRYPSRHAYEWSFALSVLAAYGWDALTALAARRRRARGGRDEDATEDRPGVTDGSGATEDRPNATEERPGRREIVFASLACAACAAVALAWWRDTFARPLRPNFGLDCGLIPSLPEWRYVAWKLAFTCAVSLALWRALRLAPTRARAALLASAVALALYVEPRILQAHVWFHYARDAAAFTEPPPASRWLAQFAPEENRVFTRVNLFVRGYWTPPPVDLPNMTAARGLHNVAGYDQLILERYSRALGDAGPDAVNPRYGLAGAPDATLFEPRSRVLDLLNATRVVTFENLSTSPVGHDGAATAGVVPTRPADSTSAVAGLDPARWQLEYDAGGVWVLRNLRACPRAWLVGEAVSVDGEEALRRARAGGETFDPMRTALVEDAPAEMPRLAGGALGGGAAARVVEYGPNRLAVETEADRDALLVLSEMFYPGWEATVDGEPARIHLTDFLLRSVAVPAGRHRVEMRYRAPAARNGVIVSAGALALVLALGLGGGVGRARGRLSAR